MDILEYIKTNQQFATLPNVATKVLKMLRSEEPNINEIVKVVEQDPGLTLKLINITNSPIYALRAEVTSIQSAIMTLGLNKLTNLILSISLYSKFLAQKESEFVNLMDLFWQHSASTGAVSKYLCGLLKQNYKELEFLGGLLHDIGKLAMLQFNTTKYKEVIRLVSEGYKNDLEAEKMVYGITHLEVGRILTLQWDLPKELVDVVSYHNTPFTSKEFSLLLAIIRFSDILCEMWGEGFYEGIDHIKLEDDQSWKVIKKYAKDVDLDFERITFELEQEFQKSSQFLKIVAS